ncbi:hypothetical protein [Arthrobacter sp. SAFR-044]
MMTLTGEWNARINAFPAFADSARVAPVNAGTGGPVTLPVQLRRR